MRNIIMVMITMLSLLYSREMTQNEWDSFAKIVDTKNWNDIYNAAKNNIELTKDISDYDYGKARSRYYLLVSIAGKVKTKIITKQIGFNEILELITLPISLPKYYLTDKAGSDYFIKDNKTILYEVVIDGYSAIKIDIIYNSSIDLYLYKNNPVTINGIISKTEINQKNNDCYYNIEVDDIFIANIQNKNKNVANMNDEEYYNYFVCPETLATKKEVDESIKQFLEWVGKQHSDWTVEQAIKYRYYLLEKKGCKKTLENINKKSK